MFDREEAAAIIIALLDKLGSECKLTQQDIEATECKKLLVKYDNGAITLEAMYGTLH